MGKWDESLCGCCQPQCFCVLVVLVPIFYPCYQGWVVNKATGESCCTASLCPLLGCCVGAAVNRGKIRDRYLIDGGFCEDCLLHCFCAPCALCQEYREVASKER